MTKLIYNNGYEKEKWKITQWFIDNYVDSTKFIFEGFGGLGIISEMYTKTGALLVTHETNLDTFLILNKKLKPYPEAFPELADSYNELKSYPNDFWDVIDLDPWSNASKYIPECMRTINRDGGFILLTSGEPYAISRFKATITKYGNPITDWDKLAQQLFKFYIVPKAEEYDRTVELIKYFNSPRISRLIIKVK